MPLRFLTKCMLCRIRHQAIFLWQCPRDEVYKERRAASEPLVNVYWMNTRRKSVICHDTASLLSGSLLRQRKSEGGPLWGQQKYNWSSTNSTFCLKAALFNTRRFYHFKLQPILILCGFHFCEFTYVLKCMCNLQSNPRGTSQSFADVCVCRVAKKLDIPSWGQARQFSIWFQLSGSKCP